MKPLQYFYNTYDKIGQFRGCDSKGNLKVKYIKWLLTLSADEVVSQAEKVVYRWVRSGRPKNDYFWKMNACYFMLLKHKRQKDFQDIYQKLNRKWKN